MSGPQLTYKGGDWNYPRSSKEKNRGGPLGIQVANTHGMRARIKERFMGGGVGKRALRGETGTVVRERLVRGARTRGKGNWEITG